RVPGEGGRAAYRRGRRRRRALERRRLELDAAAAAVTRLLELKAKRCRHGRAVLQRNDTAVATAALGRYGVGGRARQRGRDRTGRIPAAEIYDQRALRSRRG